MKRTIFALGLLAGAAAANLASAAYTQALDPLADAVAARRVATDTSTRSGRKDVKALGTVHGILIGHAGSVAEDLGLAKRAGRRLGRRFPGNEPFGDLLETALDDLADLSQDQRQGLGRWTGRLGKPSRERKLTRALSQYDARTAKAAEATGANKRARLLHSACRRLDWAERKLDIDPLPPEPPGAAPDFLLADVNPTSPTGGTNVTPRSFLGKVSAFYFGKAH